MDFYITLVIKTLLMPPGGFVFLIVLGLYLLKRNLRYARYCFAIAALGIYLMSLPLVSGTLMTMLERYPAVNADQLPASDAKAIVVLAAGREKNAAEFGGDTVSGLTLERLRYGVYLHHKTGLPLLVTGGRIYEEDTPEGELMAKSLTQDFQLQATWQEIQSRNTAENAIFSRKILEQENIENIYLVTHAWHMPRAVYVFEAQGFNVTAAPTRFEGFVSGRLGPDLSDFIPNINAFRYSYYAMHEMIGYMWYRIRY